MIRSVVSPVDQLYSMLAFTLVEAVFAERSDAETVQLSSFSVAVTLAVGLMIFCKIVIVEVVIQPLSKKPYTKQFVIMSIINIDN